MRRVAWLALGFGLGAAATHKATRGGRAPVLVTTAGGVAARIRRRVDGALAEGRAEMREREARLREEFAIEIPDDATVDEVAEARRLRGREAGDRR